MLTNGALGAGCGGALGAGIRGAGPVVRRLQNSSWFALCKSCEHWC